MENLRRIPNPIFECIAIVVQLHFLVYSLENVPYGPSIMSHGKGGGAGEMPQTEAVNVSRGLSEKNFPVTSLTVQRAPTSLQTETDVFVNYKIKYMFVVEIPKYFSWQTESI